MKEIRTAYTLLGLEEDATPDQIKRAWRDAAKKLHPDRGGNEAEFQKMKKSYEVLINPESRVEYDLKIKKVRRQEAIRSKGQKVMDTMSSFFKGHSDIEKERQQARERARQEQERVNRNRENSPHAEYYRQQEEAERAWRADYESMMEDYWAEQKRSVGVEKVLHSTDEILHSILSDGIVRMGKAKLERDPVSVDIDSSIKVEGRAKEVVEDLRDSILEAERLVRMFNKFTGGI